MNAQWVITILLMIIAWGLREFYSFVKISWKEHNDEEKTRWEKQEVKDKKNNEVMTERFNILSQEVKDILSAFDRGSKMFMEETSSLKEKVTTLKYRVDGHEKDIDKLKSK